MRVAVSALIFALSFGFPFLLRLMRARRWGLPVRIAIDPADPDPRKVASYLAEVACRLDERPERMRLVIEAFNFAGRAVVLDWERDRRIAVRVEGMPVCRLDLRNRWIPDHPVPLSLQPRARFSRKTRPRVLYVDPVDANRFRVLTSPEFGRPPAVLFFCTIAATVALVFVVPELLALALGVFAGSCLAQSPR
ncbi:MAG: hypothetical protein ACI4Q3_10370 [Kiritimatiellia bacterium]